MIIFVFPCKFILICLVQLSSNGSGSSNEISPVYSLWATFMGLYIANYVVERSTGYADFLSTSAFPISTEIFF
jgi:hypothetical protein